MRTDVKLGLVCSVVVIVVAGWYFLDRDTTESAIPLDDQPLTFVPEGPEKTDPPRQETPRESRKLAATPTEPEPAAPIEDAAKDDAEEQRTDADPILADLFKSEEQKKNDEAAELVQPAPQPESDSAAITTTTSHARPDSPRMETHTVQPGDTIVALARLFYGNVRYAKPLLEANPQVVDPTALVVGTEIVLPDVELPEPATFAPPRETATIATRRSADIMRRNEPNARADRTHTVVEGDTLYRIALNQLGEGMRWDEIYQINKSVIGDDPAALKIGMVLKLPKK